MLSQALIRTDAQGNKICYVYGLGLIGRHNLYFNRRGSTVPLTDINCNIADTFRYGSYGEQGSFGENSKLPFEFNVPDVLIDEQFIFQVRGHRTTLKPDS